MIEKPFVLVNCAMSLDGKLSTVERKQVRISSPEDLRRVDSLRAESDAVLVGLNTVLIDDPKLDVKSEALRKMRLKRGLPENPMKVTVGRIDSLKPDSVFLNSGGKKIILTIEGFNQRKFDELSEFAEIYVLGKERVDFNEALGLLSSFGVKRLMVEGGGSTIFEFFRENLVDEVHVAIGPIIFGGREAPTMADGVGFSFEHAPRLKLLGVDELGESVVLRYSVLNPKKYI